MGLFPDAFEQLAEGLNQHLLEFEARKRLNGHRNAFEKDKTRNQFLVFLSFRGSTTAQIGNWTKEADKIWKSVQNMQMTTILQVGSSESSQILALDARGWLETKGSSVQFAIVLEIDRNTSQITIKRWERCQQSSNTTQALPKSAIRTDEISINYHNNMTTVTGDLSLLLEKLVGRKVNTNNSLERDFVIPRRSLQAIRESLERATLHVISEGGLLKQAHNLIVCWLKEIDRRKNRIDLRSFSISGWNNRRPPHCHMWTEPAC